MTIISEPIPGYDIRTKSEIAIAGELVTISRVLDSKIYKFELETDSILALERISKLNDDDFRMFGRLREQIGIKFN